MRVEAHLLFQLVPRRRVAVREVVVRDQLDVEILGHVIVDLLEESQPLPLSVLFLGVPEQLARSARYAAS